MLIGLADVRVFSAGLVGLKSIIGLEPSRAFFIPALLGGLLEDLGTLRCSFDLLMLTTWGLVVGADVA
tara:strand:+ start:1248 stop:1451 length:204 start_codon:yes stop_codon:yes gene_type:complete